MDELQLLVSKIKKKKELSGLSEQFILSTLKEFISKNAINISSLRERDERLIVKEIRSSLRLAHGRFHSLGNKHKSEIESHSSTQEREDIYPKLKEIIKKINPRSILDLGCGLNPVALIDILSGVKYYASDINVNELQIIKQVFEKNHIDCETFIMDLVKIESQKLPEVDLCLIFKVLDIIDKKGHKNAERVISSIKCKTAIVSFATRKLSGKPMKYPKRKWFELMLTRLNHSYDVLEFGNEIFYIITFN